MAKRYYMGFAASQQLEEDSLTLLRNFDSDVAESQVSQFEKVMDNFLPEMIQSLLLDSTDAVGIQGWGHKFVHSTADVMTKTAHVLMHKMIKNRSNDDLVPMVVYVETKPLYGRKRPVPVKHLSPVKLKKDFYDRVSFVIEEIKQGRAEDVQEELHDLMSQTVDIMLDGFMDRAIALATLNVVMRKIANGAVATCRGAGHAVVNKVFKKLESHQLTELAHFYENMLVTAEA